MIEKLFKHHLVVAGMSFEYSGGQLQQLLCHHICLQYFPRAVQLLDPTME